MYEHIVRYFLINLAFFDHSVNSPYALKGDGLYVKFVRGKRLTQWLRLLV